MTVTAAARGYYDVTSERDETVSYMVQPGKSCTCPHHQCRGAYCKHMVCVDQLLASQPQPTKLERAAAVAETLPDADLKKWAAEKVGTPAGCACLLVLAKRQAERQPQVNLEARTCTCREFTERRDGKRIGVLFVTCDHLQEAKRQAERQPRPIPAGVLELLAGATEAEKARALEIYR